MHRASLGERSTRIFTWKHIWKPFRIQKHCKHSSDIRLLLADHEGRRQRLRPTLRRMSKIHTDQTHSCQITRFIGHSLVFHEMGNKHRRQTPSRSNQKVFVLVLMNYFTEWIEVEAFSKVRDMEVMNFLWKNIICWFGIPRKIVTKNGLTSDSIDAELTPPSAPGSLTAASKESSTPRVRNERSKSGLTSFILLTNSSPVNLLRDV